MTLALTHFRSGARLKQVQGSLPVSLIMVPRASFAVCHLKETAADVQARNRDDFSSFPVVDENGRILGLYNAARWFRQEAPNLPVEGDYTPLGEDILIGANASIFDFLCSADVHHTRLVVAGDGIAGLVSLSDVQQLPVRAALFALITSFEIAMAALIAAAFPDDAWKGLMSDGRQAALKKNIETARNQDTYTNDLLMTQFCDKADIIRKGQLLGLPPDWIDEVRKEAQKLRDNLAHGNEIAPTIERARRTCQVVRDVLNFMTAIDERLSSTSFRK